MREEQQPTKGSTTCKKITMAIGGGLDHDPPLPHELSMFWKMVAACNKWPANENQQKFVKRMETIPTVALLTEEPYKSTLNLVE